MNQSIKIKRRRTVNHRLDTVQNKITVLMVLACVFLASRLIELVMLYFK